MLCDLFVDSFYRGGVIALFQTLRIMFTFTYLSLFPMALFSSPTFGLGLNNLKFMRELELAAELGVDPGQYLSGQSSLHDSLVSHGPNQAPAIPAEYVEVRPVLCHPVVMNFPNIASQIPIDHSNVSVGTYMNRFWVNEDFFVPGNPVILYDAGESSAEGTAQSRLTSEFSFFRKMLQEFSAIGIVWEHRFVHHSRAYRA